MATKRILIKEEYSKARNDAMLEIKTKEVYKMDKTQKEKLSMELIKYLKDNNVEETEMKSVIGKAYHKLPKKTKSKHGGK